MITNNYLLQQGILSDMQMRELDAKRENVFARLRALGCTVGVMQHDCIDVTIPKGREDEAYEALREILPNGEFRFRDIHKKPEDK